jgi:serine/threonine-protein kinase
MPGSPPGIVVLPGRPVDRRVTQLPIRIAKYEIRRAIGRGAMGVVLEGYDPVIERTVAIKTMRVDELDPDVGQQGAQRFLVEAKAAGRLSHRNIVAIYDYGEQDGLLYIVLELVRGRELAALFAQERRFSLAQVVTWMGELLDALGYAHARGIVHRDVKPHNIFITDDGHVKLGDFGIARIDASLRTHEETLLGTPAYMAPEQLRAERGDARSDLYAAGVVLYQFLTGTQPFTGGMVPVMHKVLTEAPRPPSALAAGIAPALDAVVLRSLAKSPADRYPTADAFRRALVDAAGAAGGDDADQTVVLAIGTDAAALNALAATPGAPLEAGSPDPLETPIAAQEPVDSPGAVVPGEPVLEPDPLRAAPADWALEAQAARPMGPSLQRSGVAAPRASGRRPRVLALVGIVAAAAACALAWLALKAPGDSRAIVRAPDPAAASSAGALAPGADPAASGAVAAAATPSAPVAPAIVAPPPSAPSSVEPAAVVASAFAGAPTGSSSGAFAGTPTGRSVRAVALPVRRAAAPASAIRGSVAAVPATSNPARAEALSPDMAAAWQRAQDARARLDRPGAASRPASGAR